MIFNHENFACPSFSRRAGTDADLSRLTAALKQLGFQVKVFNDLTRDVLMEEAEKGKVEKSESENVELHFLNLIFHSRCS